MIIIFLIVVKSINIPTGRSHCPHPPKFHLEFRNMKKVNLDHYDYLQYDVASLIMLMIF